MPRGKYIVIEGNDGTGKSTQVEELSKRLQFEGIESIEFHEPAGTQMSNAIRDIIKDARLPRDPKTNLLLFTAARLEIWKKVDALLDSGVWAISARNYISTFVYQGAGEGLDPNLISEITNLFLPRSYVYPDLTLVLALQPSERQKRLLNRNSELSGDTFERRNSRFQKKIDQQYFNIAKEFQLPIINADQTISEVSNEIWEYIEPILP